MNNQQMGNVWSREADIVSLSLSGDLNVFDHRVGDKPARVVTVRTPNFPSIFSVLTRQQGPQKTITAVAPSSTSTFLAGAADGRVVEYTTASGEAVPVGGEGHTSLIVGLAAASDGKVFSAGYDDRVREIGAASFSAASISTAAQPKAIAVAADGTVFVVEAGGVEAIRNNQKVAHLPTKYVPSAVGTTAALVAVGGEVGSLLRLVDLG